MSGVQILASNEQNSLKLISVAKTVTEAFFHFVFHEKKELSGPLSLLYTFSMPMRGDLTYNMLSGSSSSNQPRRLDEIKSIQGDMAIFS